MREWVWTMSEWGWAYLGGPLSLLQAKAVESFDFSLVEICLWVLIPAALLSLWPKFFKAMRLPRYLSWALLFLMLAGQGVFSPFYASPSAWRTPVHDKLSTRPVDSALLHSYADLAESKLQSFHHEALYLNLRDSAILHQANQQLDFLIDSLGYAPGRPVAKIKEMQGLSRKLGEIYGGPAYHDPLTTEIALAPNEFPLPKYWRIMAIFHECAHAKGFTREIDAELLTWFALDRAGSLYTSIAQLMFLNKTGLKQFQLPSFWLHERDSLRALRKAYFAQRPIENFFKESSESLGLINTGDKYGSLKDLGSISSNHPFFGPVLAKLGQHGRS